jgi:pilus assembly protein CpaB
MDRRRILLVVAVLVAALGSAMVFLYTKGADNRAAEKFETVTVMEAVAPINPGETIEDAYAAQKIAPAQVPSDSLLAGAQTTADGLSGTVALQTIYPGEQIVAEKFGTSSAVQTSLQIPDGLMATAVSLTDTGRVAGFVNPGSNVAIFWTGSDQATGESSTRLLADRVTVIGVGSTTTVATTTTDETGAVAAEQLPRTVITLAVSQKQLEQLQFAASNGELSFGLLTDKSDVTSSPGVTAASLFQQQ